MHWWVVGVIRGRDRIARVLKGASEKQRHHHKYETDVGWHFKKWIQSPPLLRLVFFCFFFYTGRRTWHPSPSLSLRHSPLLTIASSSSSSSSSTPPLFSLVSPFFFAHNPVEPAMHRLYSPPFIRRVSCWCFFLFCAKKKKKKKKLPNASFPLITSEMASNLPPSWLRSILNDPFRKRK